MDAITWVDVASITIALLALGVSIFQVRWSARESRYTATFEHLRKVTEVIHRANHFDLDNVSAEYLCFFRRERTDLTEGAAEFGALLTELDFLCLAIANKRVDKKLTTQYLSSAIGPMSDQAEKVIKELRICFSDPTVYLDLGRMLPSFAPRKLEGGSNG